MPADSPFLFALKTDPDRFLGALGTAELRTLAGQCIDKLAARAMGGDTESAGALMILYRQIGEVEC
ncbi:hypothetical protein [Roseospirillum parvum]|uniref:Uncharacterized protein n=1 Tax=Roseospirillum parvum TaxID=83401 RepID=A0A1G8C2D6_9PROT|nr:hypothetical protein [Roseospirillum parvum]SDH39661.1 hypothetical protein SAMN05421742_106185 [Roseospirillum parvum]